MKKLLLVVFAVCLFSGCAAQMGRGSSKSLYSVSEVLEVNREDVGKSIQVRLDQKVFFNFDSEPAKPGQWSLVDYYNRTLLLLSGSPKLAEGHWGVLFQARALGSSEVTLRFTPSDENASPETVTFEISITR